MGNKSVLIMVGKPGEIVSYVRAESGPVRAESKESYFSFLNKHTNIETLFGGSLFFDFNSRYI